MSIDVEQAKRDPSSVFCSPQELVQADISKEDKILILKQWSYDLREMEVAEDEAMIGDSSPAVSLADVLKALAALGCHVNEDDAPPTKQGGDFEE